MWAPASSSDTPSLFLEEGAPARQWLPLVAREWPSGARPMDEPGQGQPVPPQGTLHPAAPSPDATGTRAAGTAWGRRGTALLEEGDLGEYIFGRDLSGPRGDRSYRHGGEGLPQARPEDTPDQGHPILRTSGCAQGRE